MTDLDDINFLENLIQFLKEHEYLFKYPNKDIFITETFTTFVEKWSNLCKLTDEELLKLPYDKNLQETCDSKLSKFFEKIQQFSILKPFPTVSMDMDIPKKLFIKMKMKKEYEIRKLLPIFLKECEKVGVKTVIDIGCGTVANALILNEFVTTDSIQKIDELIILHGPVAIISLHGCGNLQKVLLQIKASINPSNIPLLFTLGCCYHKRTNENSNEWAISETIKTKLKNASLFLPTSALRLGCDRGLLQWTQQTSEQFEAHKNAVFNRAIIETIFPESAAAATTTSTTCHRNTNRNLTGNLISTICDKHNVQPNERSIKEEELKKSFEKYSNYKNFVQPFSMLQSAIQNPMETLILLDSAYFLKENNQSANFQALFDVLQSPRNMCLICS
uniref:Methyltransferase domain-containing protein n=1 Tax=Panagrolaimus sp. ES5 TaxID=591445 RepID=A0AC34FQG1_9BILA